MITKYHIFPGINVAVASDVLDYAPQIKTNLGRSRYVRTNYAKFLEHPRIFGESSGREIVRRPVFSPSILKPHNYRVVR
eukprot:1022234-Amorphochlora_amoeboformis.AAC.1